MPDKLGIKHQDTQGTPKIYYEKGTGTSCFLNKNQELHELLPVFCTVEKTENTRSRSWRASGNT